ncbi:MAG: thermonuclease family protein [Planctomycetes bacterium]|nr:thermonuclease family protein [Planctomycetota bacterium]
MRRMAGSDRRTTIKVVLVAGLMLAVVLGLLVRPESLRRGPLPERGRVRYVYDGDTVAVDGLGKVRLVGIDAMDGYNERRAREQAGRHGLELVEVKKWAKEGTRFAKETLENKTVGLEYGPELYDDYGRVLAYVELEDGSDFDLLMIRKGLAAAYRKFPHPRRQSYLEAEQEACRGKVGMWQDARNPP